MVNFSLYFVVEFPVLDNDGSAILQQLYIRKPQGNARLSKTEIWHIYENEEKTKNIRHPKKNMK